MRSTNTWSPISRVFSIELDGMVNACRAKVMMNSPVTRTMAIEAINSEVVSFGFSGFSRLDRRGLHRRGLHNLFRSSQMRSSLEALRCSPSGSLLECRATSRGSRF